MALRFEALQARYGDCLLLTVDGAGGKTARLLIDGGPAGVFRSFLKPRLALEASGTAPVVLDAVMVSHIDEDHVLGVLDLFAAVQDADRRHAPRPYQPRFLLLNSLDSLAGEGSGGVARAIGGETVLASLGSGSLPLPGDADPIAREVLASYAQGSKLESLAGALKVPRNPPDQSVLMLETPPRQLVLGEARIVIIGPLREEVEDLRREWSAWKAKQKGDAALAAYLDKSVPNLSSIVGLVEYQGRRVLITGDARGDKVLKGLEAANLKPAGGILRLDVAKLPHHGSSRNLAIDFFQQIHADHYVVSGDGTYGNPDRDTLLMLEAARPGDHFTLHMTYDAASCDATHKAWRERRGSAFVPAQHAIADVIDRFRNDGRIAVKEGPVDLRL